MELSQENIEFINNYLEKSDINYFDIRMEMADHVASEIENRMKEGDKRGFYLIFKDYMLEHKTELLKDYKRFTTKVFKKVMLRAGHNLYHPKVLALALLALAVVYMFPGFFTAYWEGIHLAFTAGLFLSYFLPHFFSKRQKESQSHLLWVGLAVFNYFTLNFLPYEKIPESFFLWIVMILCWGNAAFLKSFLDVKKYYKRYFQVL